MGKRLKNMLFEFLRQADLVLLSLCMVSTLYGMLLISSATRYMGGARSLRLLLVQAAAMGIGIMLYIFFSVIDVENLIRKWKWMLVFNIGFICLLKTPFGVDDGTGNLAWLKFPGVPVSIQPAEIVKLTFVLLLAKQLEWLLQERKELKTFKSVSFPAAHLVFMVALIYVISGDMGSALVYVFIFICMMLSAGTAWRWFALGLGGGGIGCALLYKLGKIPVYMVERFKVIFDHSYDPLGKGWQQTRSLLAIGSGGWWGQGLYQGTQTQSSAGNSLPKRHTDFIFSVAGEELGFLGCVLIIVLLFAIVVRCFQISRETHSGFAAYVCVGMAGMLMFQTIENIGMCLFVMPVIGLTLPFFSYGGSSVVTLFAAMGIVSGIKMHALPERLRR